ncbi:ATPase AAA [Bradyrhizobium sp. LTSPM299]|uniref:sigma-54-dependent transcriptional regulator n=1 Tax=Bradyrhizobium sp. LTSPM299 TaxID=1619233 RepID=UPI0005C95D4D|nr:sigma-54 dependent transcriptional regulator [Bradyrhizobium sp. LTSPM299]KJC62240.1 ATPase AAA [Bradyrhizobium sp. LTSPM299]
MTHVLIVDDDKALRDALCETVRDLGYRTTTASTGHEALALAATSRPDAVLLDLRMPDISGLDVLKRLREAETISPPVAIMTAYATAANTIEAMRLGAFDHVTKPVGRDDLASLLRRMVRSRSSTSTMPKQADRLSSGDELIGSSASMRAVQKIIGLVADSDTTVLITGETGTGKEVVARTIHHAGARSDGPFVALNCAAIPADLLESELFGHVRGAFTGAVTERKGAFRDAGGGTLFLDEIGDMDLAMQAKILRAIQERVVTPVGGRPQPVDVRIAAATHRDLPQWVSQGKFREDLFYRLNVVPIALQPLRDRAEDILPLAQHFLRLSADRPIALSAQAVQRIAVHPWPGNIRELRNAMERAAIFCRGDILESDDLDFLGARDSQPTITTETADLPSALEGLERKMIADALAQSRGNRAEAARKLGIHRQLLHSKLAKYGLGDTGRA